MKYLAIVFSLALTGCQVMQFESMLETAPKTNYDVLYPDWGAVQQPVQQNAPQKKTIANNYGSHASMGDSLEVFLRQHRIDYELLPGDHIMVKLSDHINFNTGSATPPNYNQWLDILGDYLAKRTDIDVVIEGHTDNTGSDYINDPLSEKRAKQIKARLEKNNVLSSSIYTRGFGEYVPACNNQSSQGKACNRRVELMLIVSN
ncbi:MAG: OmpA family protein [Vibrio gallaecicus]